MAAYLIGIDIGGTGTKIGVFDRSDMRRAKYRADIPTRLEMDGVHILPDIAEEISLLLEEAGIEMKDVLGIGAGVPGPVIQDENGCAVVNRCVNLNWDVKDVPGELAELTGAGRVALLNDANAAALGEAVCGGEMDGTSVFVTIGTGVGGGIVTDGKAVTGAFGAAGEIGHMKVSPQHPLLDRIISAGGDIDRYGDLEYFASASGIARMASEALKVLSDDSSLRDIEVLDCKAVFDEAKAGDCLADELVSLFSDTLGTGLAAVAGVIDPDVFIIGGGVSAAGGFLLDRLVKDYRKTVFHASRETRFRLASLGNDAGMTGAACALL